MVPNPTCRFEVYYIGLWTIAPEENCPSDNCPLDNCPQIIVPWTMAPKDNCSPDNYPWRQFPPRNIAPQIITPWMIAPGLLFPDNYPKDNCPLAIYPWKLPSRKIAFRMIFRLHDCSLDKWPRGKLPSRKIVPRINYTRDLFSRRIRNCSTVTDSCLLLFSFSVV